MHTAVEDKKTKTYRLRIEAGDNQKTDKCTTGKQTKTGREHEYNNRRDKAKQRRGKGKDKAGNQPRNENKDEESTAICPNGQIK